MITLDEAARQMSGAIKMAFDADDWRSALDCSMKSVFASFAAIFIAAPLSVLTTLTAVRAAKSAPTLADSLYAKAPFAALVAGDLATFVLDWAFCLIVLLSLARSTPGEKTAAGLIVGYNWSLPALAAIMLPPVALIVATGSRAAGGLLMMPALALAFAIIYGVVRRGLGVGVAASCAIVAMLVVIGVLIDAAVFELIRILFAPQA